MKTLLLSILMVGAIIFSGSLEASSPQPHTSNFATGTEYTMVRVKYGLKKEGITSQIYVDIGTSKKHSLSGAIEVVEDGVVKVGFGNETVVQSNEVDMLNYFARSGWEIVQITELKVLSTMYTQYLFSKPLK